MTRRTVWITVVVLLALALAGYIASNTEWTETTLPMPLRGEAARNPFYAAQRFSEQLGATSQWDHLVPALPRDAVVVVSGWHWNLSAGRRERLEAWVRDGGRLVLDSEVLGGDEDIEKWTGIQRLPLRPTRDDDGGVEESQFARCRDFTAAAASPGASGATLKVCGLDSRSSFRSARPIAWGLSERRGRQALRVSLGRGSVTLINGVTFRNRELLEGDNARLFAAATQLRRGDEIHFLSEDDHPSLLTLLWDYGHPAIVLGVLTLALALWRNAARLGPLAALPDVARRSLVEQIRGTGRFALDNGDGASLYAATAQALESAARQRVPRYRQLGEHERVAALARLTQIAEPALAAALGGADSIRQQDLRGAIATLETARRRMLAVRRRPSHDSE